jgi:hypothetical protein
MSKLMWIAGILLAAAGVALGLMVLVSAASLDGLGIGLELAALLLVGGILSLGLGSVISLLDQQRALLAGRAELGAAAPQTAIPEFGRKAGETAAVVAAAREGEEVVSEPTRDTIKALEQARQKIEQAFEPKTPAAEAEQEAAAPEAEPAEEATEQPEVVPGQLYVVEERFIRLRPARILSDGTVEAETEEGWMRFENLEHLDEYLDATETAKG